MAFSLKENTRKNEVFKRLDQWWLGRDKARRLRRWLGDDKAGLYLTRLQLHVLEDLISGDFSELGKDGLEKVAGWEGPRGRLVKGLVHLGVLTADLRLPDWDENQVKIAHTLADQQVARERNDRPLGFFRRWA